MIRFENVTFRYPAADRAAVADLQLTIREGETILLTGPSGCGKSTLTRLVNGIIPHVQTGTLEGDVFIRNIALNNMPLHEICRTVGSVFQDPRSQFFTTTMEDELVFGCENIGVASDVIGFRMNRLIGEFHLNHLCKRSVFHMSSGERQRITVAAAHMMEPDVYVLDEPAANMDRESIAALAEMLKMLKSQGKTILIAEHRFDYLEDIMDRVVFMEAGRVVHTDTRVTRTLGPASIKVSKPFRSKSLQLCNVSFGYRRRKPILWNINLVVVSGDVIGLVGVNGSGKSTLVKGLCGLLKEQSGQIRLDGQLLSANVRMRRMHLVMQDCDYQLFTTSVEHELRLANEAQTDLQQRIEQVLRQMDLLQYRERHPMTLSCGQKQRLAIATALMQDVDVLIFDEPTSGMDGEHIRQFIHILQEQADSGRILFIISHDGEFLRQICTKTVILERGNLTVISGG
jgi:energy-coupling factor transport system ATP-binding protein